MDDQASNLMTIAATVIVLAIYTMKKKKRTRRTWVTKYLAGRPRCGVSNIILRDIINSDGHGVEEFVRLNAKEFNWLLQIIRPKVIKQDSVQRDAITPCDRLALTLRFLATGDSYSSLMYLFRISPSSITNIIPEVCDAIYEGLSDYLRVIETSKHPKLQVSKAIKYFESLLPFIQSSKAFSSFRDSKKVVKMLTEMRRKTDQANNSKSLLPSNPSNKAFSSFWDEANQNPGYKYPWLRNASGITRKKKAKTTRKDNNTEAKDVRNLFAYFFAQRDVNGSDI
ncbi:hypothetical protein TrispH2_010224 [Trichoplax sp. H2]|nr:hypothetical protein TrispH2_010224 [Trichoplax sp. H2]|eukprot:RDD37615.1 hypothetical protein TrispH2_010224 [Trichoplax sp. H2]